MPAHSLAYSDPSVLGPSSCQAGPSSSFSVRAQSNACPVNACFGRAHCLAGPVFSFSGPAQSQAGPVRYYLVPLPVFRVMALPRVNLAYRLSFSF